MTDVLTFYAQNFRAGMVDLSESSAPVRLALPTGVADGAAGYAEPGGLRELRERIAARYLVPLSPDAVVVTSGASEALAAAGHALLGPRDGLVAAPGTYPGLLAAAARRRAVVRTAGAPEHATVTAVTNPTAPGGAVVEIAAIAATVERAGGRLVADEVYADLALDGRIARAVEVSERAVSVGGLSKSTGHGGLRIGWAVTRDPALAARLRQEVQLLSGGPSVLSMRTAIALIDQLDGLLPRLAVETRAATSTTLALLRRHGWDAELPAAGVTMLAIPPWPVSAVALARLRAAGLFLLPGEVLGQRGGFRLNVFTPGAELERALTMLEAGRPEALRPPPETTVVVLTKAPIPGFSKSRLAATLGPNGAAALAEAFLRDTIRTVANVGRPVVIACAPPSAVASLAAFAPGATVVAQPEGDLGVRITAALAAGGRRAILIGSDTPDLPARVLEDAVAALDGGADVVLGPARDGGFYLAGWAAPRPALFLDVEWSTERVLAQVLRNAGACGLRVSLLEEWDDVDDAAGLARLADRLRGGCGSGSMTCAALRDLALENPRGA